MPYQGKPIIGIVGGIGAGKSFVASLFGELGCEVIRSDDVAKKAYETDEVKSVLMQWWGADVFQTDGSVDRKKVAARIFTDDAQRLRLEELIHPIVNRAREEQMARAPGQTRAFIWDTPLLAETGLDKQCDFVVFVDAPLEIRQKRVGQTRGWAVGEIERREKFQIGLDKKRKISQYTVVNADAAEVVRSQVQQVLSRILQSKLPEKRQA